MSWGKGAALYYRGDVEKVMRGLEEPSHKLVSVGLAYGQVQAEIMKGLLNANEVDVWLSNDSAGLAIGFGIGPMAEVDIMVRAEQAEQARWILEQDAEAEADA